MKAVVHVLIFLAYAALSTAVTLLAPEALVGAPIALGVSVFAVCALVHNVFARRAAEERLVNNLLTLKRAYDVTKEDVHSARVEIARLYELLNAPESKRSKPIAASSQTASPEYSSRPPAPDLRPPSFLTEGSEETDTPHQKRTSPPVQTGAKLTAETRLASTLASPAKPEARIEEPPPTPDAEIDVMQNLLEKLYAAGPPVGAGSTHGAAHGAAFGAAFGAGGAGGAAPAKSSGANLRVVSGADLEASMLDVVRDALKKNRVDLYLQPIVSLPQRKRRFFECFSRIRSETGEIIAPDDYINLARQAGLLTAIDNMLLFRCVQLLHKLQRGEGSMAFFCNISPHTLADREFLKDFIDYMDRHVELAPNLVLEFAQRDFEAKLPAIQPELTRLGGLGYRFSMDRVRNIDLDARALAHTNVHFVKVDAALLMDKLNAGAGADVRILKQQLDNAGVDLIIERIETEQMLIELLDYNIDYGQGFLFGEPRISKDPAIQGQRSADLR